MYEGVETIKRIRALLVEVAVGKRRSGKVGREEGRGKGNSRKCLPLGPPSRLSHPEPLFPGARPHKYNLVV